jgi:hypothetical protein
MTNTNTKLQAIKNKLSDMKEFVRKVDEIRAQIEHNDDRVLTLSKMRESVSTTIYVSEKPGVYYQVPVPEEIRSLAISAAIVEIERDTALKNKELEKLIEDK